jgi:HTH-type transcriptional regulator, transcriptional repressor of NAD biosynthesis genes
MRIAILGAQCTGKTSLATALWGHLNQLHTLLITDTTPLMVAIDHDLRLKDGSLYPSALEHQHLYDLTLVTAPDLASDLQRDDLATQTAVDRQLRTVLQASSIPFSVIYGTGETRTQSALDAIAHWQRKPRPRSAHDTEWKWSCDTCSDPQCEHRLFSKLLASS